MPKQSYFIHSKVSVELRLYLFEQALLEENPAKHPIIILKDVPFQVGDPLLFSLFASKSFVTPKV